MLRCFACSCWCIIVVFYASGLKAQDDPPVGISVQLPTLGVSIDSAGVLATKVFPDPDGSLMMARVEVARRKLQPQFHRKSQCRKISLRRLEKAVAALVDAGKPVDQDMTNLAGLTCIDYVFLMPGETDIVIAGPAEPWVENPAGRTIGIYSGEPTMLLSDLITAVRTFGPGRKLNSWVACSINPTAQGLDNLKRFQQQLPNNVQQQDREQAADVFANELRNSLGLADVVVYGIDPQSHAAHVMIEADYRMKLIAVGLELPPVRMTTFIGALKGAPRQLQRWWLTPNYKCLRQSDDKSAVQLVGRDVRLQTENIHFGAQPQSHRRRIKPSRAARLYASSFTKNYEKISAIRPVFAQLRNVIDVLVAAAWINKNNGYARVNWTPDFFLSESRYAAADLDRIEKAQCVANAVWKQNVLVLPAGGGVSIMAADALKVENLLDDSHQRIQEMADLTGVPADTRWWWD